ncbi:MAG TPA: hypothetical protein VGR50_03220, partial [Terriglobales bacterium]|nr:hypothetical protein [Terriglobales bacterium]
MEPRTLSSLETFPTKFVLPALSIVALTVGTMAVILSDLRTKDFILPLLLAVIALALIIRWICMPLKRVRIDDAAIYLSNYKTEIAVPL